MKAKYQYEVGLESETQNESRYNNTWVGLKRGVVGL